MSDEFGLIRPGDSRLVPVPRPMALKNESIGAIREFAPDAEIGPVVDGTRKGTVAHVKPPEESILRQNESARARWVIFPRWLEGSDLALEKMPKADGFMRLALNAFNYEVLGQSGFSAVRDVVDHADCFSLVYASLDEAVERIDALVDETQDG